MKLWILKAKAHTDNFYAFMGFVIRAPTAKQARELAADYAGDTAREYWLSPSMSSCHELKPDGKEEVVIYDYFGT